MNRVCKEAIAGVRREVTATRKELAETNRNMRTLKTDEVAKVAYQLSVGLSVQRRMLAKVAEDAASNLTAVLASQTPTGVAGPGAEGAATDPHGGSPAELPNPRTQGKMETQDAKWVLALKDELNKWLPSTFLSSTCATDVWVTTKDVHVFLRDWTMQRLRVSDKDAVRLLESPWRLPKRPRRRAAPRPDQVAPRDVPPNRFTIAYQYLHRVVTHFYQKVGAKELSAFASHVNEELSKGTLRRLRRTTSKFEITLHAKMPSGSLTVTASSTAVCDATILFAASRLCFPTSKFFINSPRADRRREGRARWPAASPTLRLRPRRSGPISRCAPLPRTWTVRRPRSKTRREEAAAGRAKATGTTMAKGRWGVAPIRSAASTAATARSG